ncbi:hypothetical protein [Streptomyces sp. NPDC059466]|uniref:hypothetical protein n=1 Tax=unclassified Streptomyces TaxID=2593676 RepID=UPI003691F89C
MSPARSHRRPHPRHRHRHRHAWVRVLALLVVAFLAAGAQAEALSASAPAIVADASGHGAEHDVPDTAARPPARPEQGRLAPPRPAPRTAPGHPDHASRPRAAAASPSSGPHTPRSVVLRC